MTQSCFDSESLLDGPHGGRLCWAQLDGEENIRLRLSLTQSDPAALISRSNRSNRRDRRMRRRCRGRLHRAALAPIAQALSRAEVTRGWTTPVDLTSQYTVTVEDPLHPEPPRKLCDPVLGLRDWRSGTLRHFSGQRAVSRARGSGGGMRRGSETFTPDS